MFQQSWVRMDHLKTPTKKSWILIGSLLFFPFYFIALPTTHLSQIAVYPKHDGYRWTMEGSWKQLGPAARWGSPTAPQQLDQTPSSCQTAYWEMICFQKRIMSKPKKHELRHEKIAANNSCTTFLLPSYLCSLNGSTAGLGSSHGSLGKQDPAVAWMNSSLKPLGFKFNGTISIQFLLEMNDFRWKSLWTKDFCCKMGCVPNARNRFLTSQESLGSKFCLGVFQFTFAGTTSGKKMENQGWFNGLSGSRSQKLLV